MEKSIKYLHNRKLQIFSFRRIIEEKLIPWSQNSRTLLKIINADMQGENILEVEVTPGKNINRYNIKGSNLLKYIAKYGNVLMRTTRHYDKNNKKLKTKSPKNG